jgi:hypothetical protein
MKMKNVRKFDFYADPGHGWLKVGIGTLSKAGIVPDISSFSYVKGRNVFLEEDCDATRFVSAMEKLGVRVEVKYHSTDKRSKIRSYWTASQDRLNGMVEKYLGNGGVA